MEKRDHLLGIIETLFKHKWTILKVCGIVLVGSIIISLLLPVYYKSSTIFYAASPDLSSPDKLFGGGNTEPEFYGNGEDIDRLMTIAEGDEVKHHLIESFNLYQHYDIDSTSIKAPYYIRLHLNGLYEVSKTKYDAIEITVEDKDPKLAAAMANAARLKLEGIVRYLNTDGRNKQFNTLKQSVSHGKEELHILSDSLAKLREKYGIYNPETQGETLSGLLATTDAKASMLRAKLKAFQDNPRTPRDTITLIKANLSGVEAQLDKVKADVKLFNTGSGMVNAMTEQQENAQTQLSWDQERLKHWKTAIESENPVIHLVEAAPVPIIKSRPIRSLIVIASTFAAFLFSLLGILLMENYKDVNWRSVVRGDENGTAKTTSPPKVLQK